MSVKYCEHDYPQGMNCPACELAEAKAQVADLKRRLIRAVSGENKSWWDKNLPEKLAQYKAWLGDHTAPSRVKCRQLIREAGYKSILDVGCGLAVEYDGFKADGYKITYLGCESCRYLVNLAWDRGLRVVCAGFANNLRPLGDSEYDVVYIREVLEHLPGYEKALKEAIRVASKEVMVVFFIQPSPCQEDKIDLQECDGAELFHNIYSRSKLETFLKAQGVRWEWSDLDESRELLRIFK